MSDTSSKVGDESRNRLLAAGSVAGGILASACCIVPLALVTVGVSGAWIGTLTTLEPYKPWFIAVTLIFLGLGFWYVYLKPEEACDDDSFCAKPTSGKITRSALWIGTALILSAASIDYWAPLLY